MSGKEMRSDKWLHKLNASKCKTMFQMVGILIMVINIPHILQSLRTHLQLRI